MLRAVSTYVYVKERLHPGLLDELVKAGAQTIEIFAARQHFDYANRKQHVREIADWFKSTGIPLNSVHAPLYSDYEWGRTGSPPVNIASTDRAGRIDAMDEIKRALDIAEPDGAVLPFLLHPVPGLLERHPRHRTVHASLIAEIMSLLGGASRSPAPAEDTSAPREPLSESETRVLRYLPTDLSAREIADELFLSWYTVKTHMRHLYAKLGTHTRHETVQRARALGLLAPSPHRLTS